MNALAEKARLMARLSGCATIQQLRAVWGSEARALRDLRGAEPVLAIHVTNYKDLLKGQLPDDPAMQHPGDVA